MIDEILEISYEERKLQTCDPDSYRQNYRAIKQKLEETSEYEMLSY